MTRLAAHRVFFPAAAMHGALVVGIWALPPSPPVPAAWHAHELVFGYAVAVVAGFLLTKSSGREVLVALALWLAARLAWTLPDTPDILRAALTVLATATVAGLASRGFLRAVKRGQNAIFPVIPPVLAICDAVGQAGLLTGRDRLATAAAEAGLVVVLMLIAVMGGRIAGAALSGLAQRSGGPRIPPQPRAERLLAASMALVAVSLAVDLRWALAVAAPASALLLAFRIVAWRAAFALAAGDLLSLVAAQALIAAGLAGVGAACLGAPWPVSAPLHLAAVGGIGIATVVMMLRTHAQRERRALPERAIGVVTALLAAAAVTRAAGYLVPEVAYPLAAVAWITAMAVCLTGMLAKR